MGARASRPASAAAVAASARPPPTAQPPPPTPAATSPPPAAEAPAGLRRPGAAIAVADPALRVDPRQEDRHVVENFRALAWSVTSRPVHPDPRAQSNDLLTVVRSRSGAVGGTSGGALASARTRLEVDELERFFWSRKVGEAPPPENKDLAVLALYFNTPHVSMDPGETHTALPASWVEPPPPTKDPALAAP
ncbi:hypothetical protein HK405_008529, partial [Cladochytrium tenue]